MRNLFIDGDDITIKQINESYSNRDDLHDAIADATDGTEPRFFIERIGYVTLIIEDGTGSTLCDINDDECYLSDLLDSIENEGFEYE